MRQFFLAFIVPIVWLVIGM